MQGKGDMLQNILEKAIDNGKIFGTSFFLDFKGHRWCGSAGNIDEKQPYFIASTTKLFITAIILGYDSQGILSLEDKVANYLDAEIINGLHSLGGRDFSTTITIKNLLAHTSGIPDYFQQKDERGNSLEKEILSGNDQHWTFNTAVERSKTLTPLFAPGTKGKAHYSDTNFQLLGKVIENLSSKKLDDVVDELILAPLSLKNTYVFRDISDTRPRRLYYKNNELYIPKAMSSFGPDGGIVSTSEEMLIFLKAFFNGAFFPKEYINGLKVWNRIFFPMQSGVGIHRFKLPWILNPLGKMPELIGHSGLSGALAYHSPEHDLYIAGTVNQVAYPDTSFRLALKLIQKILAK